MVKMERADLKLLIFFSFLHQLMSLSPTKEPSPTSNDSGDDDELLILRIVVAVLAFIVLLLCVVLIRCFCIKR